MPWTAERAESYLLVLQRLLRAVPVPCSSLKSQSAQLADSTFGQNRHVHRRENALWTGSTRHSTAATSSMKDLLLSTRYWILALVTFTLARGYWVSENIQERAGAIAPTLVEFILVAGIAYSAMQKSRTKSRIPICAYWAILLWFLVGLLLTVLSVSWSLLGSGSSVSDGFKAVLGFLFATVFWALPLAVLAAIAGAYVGLVVHRK